MIYLIYTASLNRLESYFLHGRAGGRFFLKLLLAVPEIYHRSQPLR